MVQYCIRCGEEEGVCDRWVGYNSSLKMKDWNKDKFGEPLHCCTSPGPSDIFHPKKMYPLAPGQFWFDCSEPKVFVLMKIQDNIATWKEFVGKINLDKDNSLSVMYSIEESDLNGLV